MFAGGGGSSASECLFQHIEILHFVHLHENPVRKGAATQAGNLISQQLDCAVEDSVVMRLHKALLAVIDEPDDTPALDCLPEQRIRLEHPYLFYPSTAAPLSSAPA